MLTLGVPARIEWISFFLFPLEYSLFSASLFYCKPLPHIFFALLALSSIYRPPCVKCLLVAKTNANTIGPTRFLRPCVIYHTNLLLLSQSILTPRERKKKKSYYWNSSLLLRIHFTFGQQTCKTCVFQWAKKELYKKCLNLRGIWPKLIGYLS